MLLMLQFYEIVSIIKSFNIAYEPVVFDPDEFGIDMHRIRFFGKEKLDAHIHLNAAFQLYVNAARNYISLR
jgi:hypothetical protein